MRYSALLRGINVSGQKLIPMAELKEHFVMPGIKNIVTYIQSGNVVFDAAETSIAKLRTKVEKQLASKLGYAVTVIIKSRDEIAAVIDNNPFGKPGGDRKLYVTFLAEPAPTNAAELVNAYIGADEQMNIAGDVIYFATPSYGNTKFSNTLIERKLKTQATTRNWNTVNKLLSL